MRYFIYTSVSNIVFLLLMLSSGDFANAEYADIVLNENSEKEGVRPVVYPHWFHRIRFQCRVCHSELNIKMQAGANGITMSSIIDGQYCGACHNGEIAWNVDNCDLCHSAKDGVKTGVIGGHKTLGPGQW